MPVEQTSISLRPEGGSGGLRNSRFFGPCFKKSSSSTSSASAAAGSQLFRSHGSTPSLSFKNFGPQFETRCTGIFDPTVQAFAVKRKI